MSDKADHQTTTASGGGEPTGGNYAREMSEESHVTEGSAESGSMTDLNDWQQGIIADKESVEFSTLDTSSFAVAQAPMLEVIEEHEILETIPVVSIQSPVEPRPYAETDTASETPSRPVFSLGLPCVAPEDQPSSFDVAAYLASDQHRPSSPSGLSRQDSFGTTQTFYSRQVSDSGSYAHNQLAPEILEPLLFGGQSSGPSEVVLPTVSSEAGIGAFLRQVSSNLSRRMFGSTTGVSRSESVASFEVNASGNLEMLRRSLSTQRPSMLRQNSHTSVTSDASTVFTSRSTIQQKLSRRNRPARILAPAGSVVPRSKRFLTRGQAGFLNAKGNSAINLHPPDLGVTTTPCAECPYCRKFATMGQRIQLPAPGKNCTCRICVIIEESNSNQSGTKNILQLQNAAKKSVETPKRSISSTAGMRRHNHSHVHSTKASAGDFGVFCSQCSQANLAAVEGGSSAFYKSSAKPNVGPQVGVPIKEQWPVPTTFDLPNEKGVTSPSRQTSVNTSMESIFVSRPKTSNAMQINMEPPLCVSQMSIACASITSAVSAPFCRICHQLNDLHQTLMAPCRCSGTLKYVHESCLIHWLEILSRKYRRPAICELCGYKYKRSRHFRVRKSPTMFTPMPVYPDPSRFLRQMAVRWPQCSEMDKKLHCVTVSSIATMVLCAVACLLMFNMEDAKYYDNNVHGGQKEPLKWTEVVTLIAGLLFFLMFFVAMYAEVKASSTIFDIMSRWWKLNHEWSVSDYNPKHDSKFWKQKRVVQSGNTTKTESEAITSKQPSTKEAKSEKNATEQTADEQVVPNES